MLENRRHMRIREVADIRWTVLGTEAMGEGKVLNVSSSGLLVQMDEGFSPRFQGTLFIDAKGAEPLEFGAKKGKVVWSRRMPEGRPGYQCGVEFLKNSGGDKSLENWIERKVDEMAQTSNANVLNRYIV